jgi:hypothetical protein
MSALENVLSLVDDNVDSELHIIKSDSRLKLHKFLRSSLLCNEILPSFISIYEEESRKSSFSAIVTVKFHTECIKYAEHFVNILHEEISDNYMFDDLIALLNFYASATLRAKFSPTELNDTCDIETEAARPSEHDNETLRAVYCLGGGTLCDIIKLNRKRSVNLKLSTNQRNRAKVLHQTALSVSMPAEEKSDNIPIELRDRDRGHMIFPARSMLSYVRTVNAATKEYANSVMFKKLGKHLLQVAIDVTKIS